MTFDALGRFVENFDAQVKMAEARRRKWAEDEDAFLALEERLVAEAMDEIRAKYEGS